jgi:hypothetical protein
MIPKSGSKFGDGERQNILGSTAFPQPGGPSPRDDDTTADDTVTEGPESSRARRLQGVGTFFAAPSAGKQVTGGASSPHGSDGLSETVNSRTSMEGIAAMGTLGDGQETRTKMLRRRPPRRVVGSTGAPTSATASLDMAKPGIGSRVARVQWLFFMFTPTVLLLLHREPEIAFVTKGEITTERILGVTLTLAVLAGINEMLDGIQWPYYFLSMATGTLVGGTLMSTRDLTAARLLSVVLLGVGAGQLRHHWSLSIAFQAQQARRLRRLARRRGLEGQKRTSTSTPPSTAGSGSSPVLPTSAAGPLSEAAMTEEDLKGGSSKKSGRSGPGSDSESAVPQSNTARALLVSLVAPKLLRRLLIFIAIKLGFMLWFAIGEVVGCAVFVSEAWSEMILPSFWGYILVVVFPILTYKVSGWVSHLVTLLFGTKGSVSDASKMLAVYWVLTTVLSLTIIGLVSFLFLYSWLPYVWSLQLLVAPYGIVAEFVSFESRKFNKKNPYKEVVEAYKEHIDEAIANKDKYHTH